MFVTYSNLVSGNSKSCKSCGNKHISNGIEQDILTKLKNGSKIAHIAKEYSVGRAVINRIKKEFKI